MDPQLILFGFGVGVLVGNLAEIAEGLDRVLVDAFAAFVHQTELKQSHRLAGQRRTWERRLDQLDEFLINQKLETP